MTKEIQLTQEKVAIVDDDVFEEINKFKWCALKDSSGKYTRYYAGRSIQKQGKQRKTQRMHRYIWFLKTGETPKLMDHRNSNGLDNRMINLRIATDSQNGGNKRISKKVNKTSKFKGVNWCKNDNKWMARIRKDRKLIYLGEFDSEKDAAHAYDKAAIKLFAEFAHLNFPIDDYLVK